MNTIGKSVLPFNLRTVITTATKNDHEKVQKKSPIGIHDQVHALGYPPVPPSVEPKHRTVLLGGRDNMPYFRRCRAEGQLLNPKILAGRWSVVMGASSRSALVLRRPPRWLS